MEREEIKTVTPKELPPIIKIREEHTTVEIGIYFSGKVKDILDK